MLESTARRVAACASVLGMVMTTRTTTATVAFRRPFILAGFEALQPAGEYAVETEEELVETLTFPVWRRVATVMRVTQLGAVEHITIDPDKLHEALMRDGAQPDPSLPISHPHDIARRERARKMRKTPR